MPPAVFDTSRAAAYYDDEAVTAFYQRCWGGADIHIGRYVTGNETIADASAAMTRHLLDRAGIVSGDRVLDIACGYGGTLRTLARMGCQVRGIDISKACVEHARKANIEAGLSDRIDVAVGDFHCIDSAPDRWDGVICQESVIHSADRPRVFSEAYRVLRPGGVFAFSDILTGEDADLAMVEAAFARLGAAAGATARDYRDMASAVGFDVIHVEERPGDIKTHYRKLAEALAVPVAGFDAATRASIAASISRWQAALAAGHITWACFVAHKPGETGNG